EAIENFSQGQKEWDNPPNIISKQEVANLKALAKRLFRNEDMWVQMHRGIAWDKVENLDPQSTPQVLPSFEEYTPPATYPEEVEKTLGIPIEVEPLDETPLEDLGLNTYVSLGEERGPKPPIKPHSPDSFRMKEVDSLTINTPPSPHVASSHPKDMYCYCRPCIDDPKKHYGFKPVLLGKGKGLSLFDRPNEVERGRILEAHRLELILQQQISQCMAPSHHDGMYRYYHPHLNSSVGEPSPLSVK
ncbi:hypothetical protein Tco_0038755, partial [Tanacetum coccineum]